jgi:DNA-binding NarL/FixJ family response regulator
MSGIRILHAEVRTLICAGFKSILANDTNHLELASGVNQLHEKLQGEQPDIVLMDYLQAPFSVEDIFFIRENHPEVKILIVSGDNEEFTILRILESGIHGFLTEECDEEEISKAITAIMKGDKFFCNKIIDILLQRNIDQRTGNCLPTGLTERETEITGLIAEGLTSRQIAERLYISFHTVHTHRKNIMKKLGVKSSSELTLYAINSGLVNLKK